MWEHLLPAIRVGNYLNVFGGVYSDMPEVAARVFSASLTNNVDHVLSEERDGVNASVRVDGTVTASRSDAVGLMPAVSGYLAVGQSSGNIFTGYIQTHCEWSDTINAAGRAAALA